MSVNDAPSIIVMDDSSVTLNCGITHCQWGNCNIHTEQKFHSWTRRSSTKFGWDQNIEFKKSFGLNGLISIRVQTKVALNLIHFAYSRGIIYVRDMFKAQAAVSCFKNIMIVSDVCHLL